jgi:hypothetical protein
VFKLDSLAVGAALVLLVSGCSKSHPASPTIDPLTSFKVIADNCQGAIVESDSVWPGKISGVGRTIIKPGQKSFDVKKTDSLVSPHIAYIDLNFVEQLSTAATEEALQAFSTPVVSTVNHWRLTYAMQGGKWKLQEELYSFAMPDVGIKEEVPKKMEIGSLAGRVPAATACNPT